MFPTLVAAWKGHRVNLSFRAGGKPSAGSLPVLLVAVPGRQLFHGVSSRHRDVGHGEGEHCDLSDFILIVLAI